MDKAHAEMLHDQINALVDGQLPDHERAQAMERLAGDPAALETLQGKRPAMAP